VSIDYKISTSRTGPTRIDRYDAKVGPFFVGAQDNGEGWWNWWIALAEQGPAAGEHAIYDHGGALSWDAARRLIEQVLRDVADNILEALK
jgi:hypothetical protein